MFVSGKVNKSARYLNTAPLVTYVYYSRFLDVILLLKEAINPLFKLQLQIAICFLRVLGLHYELLF